MCSFRRRRRIAKPVDAYYRPSNPDEISYRHGSVGISRFRFTAIDNRRPKIGIGANSRSDSARIIINGPVHPTANRRAVHFTPSVRSVFFFFGNPSNDRPRPKAVRRRTSTSIGYRRKHAWNVNKYNHTRYKLENAVRICVQAFKAPTTTMQLPNQTALVDVVFVYGQ